MDEEWYDDNQVSPSTPPQSDSTTLNMIKNTLHPVYSLFFLKLDYVNKHWHSNELKRIMNYGDYLRDYL